MTLEEYLNKQMHFVETVLQPYQIINATCSSAISTWQNIYDNIALTQPYQNEVLPSSSAISSWQSIYNAYNIAHPYKFDMTSLHSLNQQWQQNLVNLPQFDSPYIEQLNRLVNKLDVSFSKMQPYLSEYADNCINQEIESNTSTISDINKTESKSKSQLFNDKINIIGFIFTIIFGIFSLLPNSEFQEIQQEQKKMIAVIEELSEAIEVLSNEIEQLKQEHLVDTTNLEQKYSDD